MSAARIDTVMTLVDLQAAIMRQPVYTTLVDGQHYRYVDLDGVMSLLAKAAQTAPEAHVGDDTPATLRHALETANRALIALEERQHLLLKTLDNIRDMIDPSRSGGLPAVEPALAAIAKCVAQVYPAKPS
jgi:hypothetical protein